MEAGELTRKAAEAAFRPGRYRRWHAAAVGAGAFAANALPGPPDQEVQEDYGRERKPPFAPAVLLAGRGVPRQDSLAYAGSLLWALFAIVANQYGVSALTTTIAALSAVPVALALLVAARPDRSGRGARTRTV